jgi:hypothetical protein
MNYNGAREEFRQWLVKYTSCDIQDAKGSEGGWPCGTCVMNLLDSIGLDSSKEEYQEHNEELDRHNEVWRAILQIRDAKV